MGFSIIGGVTIELSSLKQIIDNATLPGPPAQFAYRPACVFLLLYNKDEPYFLAIQKSDNDGYPWRNQIALPGGHIEKYDAGPIDAAYREVQEEVNIPRSQIDFIGSIGHYQTINDRDIEVFVGLWDGQGPLRYESAEISRVLEIPVRQILQTHITNHYHDRIPDVAELTYPFQDVVIWGVTARILHQFIEFIFPLLKNA